MSEAVTGVDVYSSPTSALNATHGIHAPTRKDQNMKAKLIAGVLLLTAGGFAAAETSTEATTTTSTSTTTTDATAAFEKMDANHDGQVSAAEARNSGMSDFSAADRNGDGQLDQSEYTQRSSTTSTITKSSKSATSASDPDSVEEIGPMSSADPSMSSTNP
jgi:hypothetical protein